MDYSPTPLSSACTYSNPLPGVGALSQTLTQITPTKFGAESYKQGQGKERKQRRVTKIYTYLADHKNSYTQINRFH